MSNTQEFHGTLIARTDKADLYRLPGDRVLKRYFTKNAVERVMQDHYSMSHINGAFAETRHDGWSYRPVKLLWLSLDRRAICMELAFGHEVLSVPGSRLNDAEYHCGIWLAHYHNAVLNGKSRGLIYTDLGVHNVLIISITGAFAETRHDGWSYRPVKLLWLSLDRRAICMELAFGHEVLSVPGSRLNDAEYHCGIWLAHYHNAVLNGKSRGLIYTDLGVHNVLIDFDRKSVTAIDPGTRA